MLLRKEPSPVEVYNDIDSEVVNLFRVLRDPVAFENFKLLCYLTPYSREEFLTLQQTPIPECPVHRAWRFFWLLRCGFGGEQKENTRFSTSKAKSMAFHTNNAVEHLDWITKRLKGVIIEHLDYVKCLEKYDSPDTLFYCDPPYILETRVGGGYRREMTTCQHLEMCEHLKTVQGNVILSGYKHTIYDALGWKVVQYRVPSTMGHTHTGHRKSYKTECLYLNFQPPYEQLTFKDFL